MIHDYLKDKRIEAGVTQAFLAESLGYSSAQYISNYERGLCNPPLKNLFLICELLEADLDKCKDLLRKDFDNKLKGIR